MTGRQRLAGLIEKLSTAEDVPSPPLPSVVGGRVEALEETSRDISKRSVLVAASECTIWPGNARRYEALDAVTLEDLIESIRAEHGNRVPVVLRRTPNGPQRYEVIYGTRRHWAVSWLNANSYPEIKLYGVVERLTDEEAFRLADVENRTRDDVSAVERGVNYAAALRSHYGGQQSRMAERLGISKGHLSMLLSIGELPNEVVAAFPSLGSITINNIRPVLQFIGEDRHTLLARAEAVSAEQKARRERGEPLIPALQVVQRLTITPAAPKGKSQPSVRAEDGRVFGKVLKDTRKELVLQLAPKAGETIEDVLAAVRSTLVDAKVFIKR